MPLPPKSNHMVTLAEAGVLTANYRKQVGTEAVKGGMFFKEILEKIINQPGCVGLRYYYGWQENGTPALVLVGVDAQGRDIVRGILGDASWLCPPYCNEVNALNYSKDTERLKPINLELTDAEQSK